MEKRITNVVGTLKFEFPINLEELYKACLNDRVTVEYVPEVFPGLILKYHLPDKKGPISILVFSNGKVVISGSRTPEEFDSIAEWVLKLVEAYKFVPNQPTT